MQVSLYDLMKSWQETGGWNNPFAISQINKAEDEFRDFKNELKNFVNYYEWLTTQLLNGPDDFDGDLDAQIEKYVKLSPTIYADGPDDVEQVTVFDRRKHRAYYYAVTGDNSVRYDPRDENRLNPIYTFGYIIPLRLQSKDFVYNLIFGKNGPRQFIITQIGITNLPTLEIPFVFTKIPLRNSTGADITKTIKNVLGDMQTYLVYYQNKLMESYKQINIKLTMRKDVISKLSAVIHEYGVPFYDVFRRVYAKSEEYYSQIPVEVLGSFFQTVQSWIDVHKTGISEMNESSIQTTVKIPLGEYPEIAQQDDLKPIFDYFNDLHAKLDKKIDTVRQEAQQDRKRKEMKAQQELIEMRELRERGRNVQNALRQQERGSEETQPTKRQRIDTAAAAKLLQKLNGDIEAAAKMFAKLYLF